MRGRSLPALIAILMIVGAPFSASAKDTVILRVGEPTGPMAVFAVDRDTKPQTLFIRTTQVGVAGSRLEVSVDNAKAAAFSHILTTEECKFGDAGSVCEVRIWAKDGAFTTIVNAFRRGRMAKVSILDAGVMKMDVTVSLIGVTKALRGS